MQPFSFAFVVTPYGCQIRLEGELDAFAAEQLLGACSRLVAGPPLVEVSLSGVSFLDSSGIQALLSIKRGLEQSGHTVTFSEASPCCRRVFEITGLEDHLGLSHSVPNFA